MTSTAPLDGTGATELTIPELVRNAHSGAIRIPTFQRSFVWDSVDVRTLFDSIYRGFPIGTILLWKRSAPAATVRFGPIELDVPASTDALWVVDGQQRITSLVGCLSQSSVNVDERFEVYFDLAKRTFVNERQGIGNPRAIPVREALSSRQVAAWVRQHADDLEPDDFDTSDSLVGVLRDYRIPAYIVAANEQDLLREVFDRVNSAGKAISRAQAFHALFASDTRPGSPASVAKTLATLGFGLLDDGRIVQSLLAVRGGNVQRDIHDEFSDSSDDPSEWYDHTELALRRAIEFLKEQGVPHLLLMPNTLPIPVLAAFFHVHPDPSPWIRRLLARWLWRGWIHGFGTESGQTPIMRRAISTINPRKLDLERAPEAHLAIEKLLEHVSDAPAPLFKVSPIRTDKAAGRIVLLALASLRPMKQDGEVIDLGAAFDEDGSKAVTDLVRGYRTTAAARGFWPRADSRPNGSEDTKVLHSHAISVAAAEALSRRDIERFLAIRENEIGLLVQRYVTGRVDAGGSARPSISDLIVVDPEDDLERA